MSSRTPKRNKKQMIPLIIAGIVALALILMVAASLVTGQWPWESSDQFEGYTGIGTWPTTGSSEEASTSEDTTAGTEQVTEPETTGATEGSTEATTAPTETSPTTPKPTTPKPTTPTPTNPTTPSTTPTTGGSDEEIDFDDLSTQPTTAPETEATQPKPSTPDIDIPL